MRLSLLRNFVTPYPKLVQPTSQSQNPPTSSASVKNDRNCKLSRREIALRLPFSSIALLSLAARAEDEPPAPAPAPGEEARNLEKKIGDCAAGQITRRVFLDVSIDGEPVGRIVMGLFGADAPVGTARFSGLVSGAEGVSYRRKEFVKVMPNYIQHGGVRSYRVDAEMAKRGGGVVESLVAEWKRAVERCPGTENVAGSVGLLVRDPLKVPPKLKLVARKGKLEIDEEEVGTSPNGTEFVITTKDSPELDASTLVIGRVVEGMEVVERINKVKTVRENTSSPYFRVAKLIGDKRAVVAERGFNRPYSKIIITNCGLID